MDERQREIEQLRAEIAAEEAQLNVSEPEDNPLSREEEIEQLRAEIAAEEEALNAPKDISRSPGKAALRQVGRIGRAGLTGLAGIADIPNLAAMGAHAAGLRETPTFYDPISEKVQGYIDEKSKGKLRAENKAEEWADTIVEGIAPLAAGVVTGGASLTSLAAKNAAKYAGKGGAKKALEKVAQFGSKTYKPTSLNIAGSLGSSAAGKTYLDNAENPHILGSLAAGMAGGLGGSSAANYKNIAAKIAGKSTRFDPDKYKNLKDLNIRMSLADTAKGDVPKRMQNYIANKFGFKNQFKEHYLGQESDIARNMGITSHNDLEGAVMNVPHHLAKEGAKGYKERFNEYKNKKFSKFKEVEDRAINNREQIDVSNLIGQLEAERSLALTPHTQDLFDKTQKGKLLRDLKGAIPKGKEAIYSEAPQISDKAKKAILGKKKAIKGIEDSDMPENIKKQVIEKYEASTPGINTADYEPQLIKAAEPAGTGVGYKDLDNMRKKALHKSIESRSPTNASTPKSREAAEISHKLSERRHNYIDEVGTPEQARHSREGKAAYEAYEAPPHRSEDTGMAYYERQITGSENNHEALSKLNSDPRYLKVARQGLKKEDRPKLAEALLAEDGRKDGRFSITKAQSAFTNLPESIQKERLRTLGDKQTQDIFKRTMKFVRDNKEMIKKAENATGASTTGKLTVGKGITGTLALGAGYAAPVTTGIALALAKGGAKLWTNQKFLARVNDSMTATTPQQLQAALKAVNRSANQAGRQTKEHLQAKKDNKGLHWDENGKPYRQ